jgi:hypothetical protein
VTALIDQPPIPDLAYLVYAIRKLIAAILDMDRGFMKRPIPAVDIGNAKHDLDFAHVLVGKPVTTFPGHAV